METVCCATSRLFRKRENAKVVIIAILIIVIFVLIKEKSKSAINAQGDWCCILTTKTMIIRKSVFLLMLRLYSAESLSIITIRSVWSVFLITL